MHSFKLILIKLVHLERFSALHTYLFMKFVTFIKKLFYVSIVIKATWEKVGLIKYQNLCIADMFKKCWENVTKNLGQGNFFKETCKNLNVTTYNMAVQILHNLCLGFLWPTHISQVINCNHLQRPPSFSNAYVVIIWPHKAILNGDFYENTVIARLCIHNLVWKI